MALGRSLPRARSGDPSAVHQARVASRRLREGLPLVASGARGRRLRRDVRRITRALGLVRELDVTCLMLDQLRGQDYASPRAIDWLLRTFARERSEARVDMVRRIERCDLAKLRRRAVAVARESGEVSSGERGRAERLSRARARVARRAERLQDALAIAGGLYLPDRLHAVRIAVKKLRYSLELVRTMARSGSLTQLQQLKKTQQLLGRMHDLEVLVDRTRALQGSSAVPSLSLSAALDRLVRGLETECRQLHGRFIALRPAVLSICDRIGAASNRRRTEGT